MIDNTFGINIIPDNDTERLTALQRYRITDTPSEESFEGIARLAAQIFNVPISLLSLVDAETVFFKANVGMGNARKAERGKSLCALAILNKEVTVFEDALKETCLQANPNVIGDFGLRFYAGAPLITHDGFLIGTLCIIDKKPRIFTDSERSILEGLARTAMDQIELRRSSMDTIDQIQKVNNQLISTQNDLREAVQNLAESSVEMEATNEMLNTTNTELIQSYDLTVSLNQDLKHSEQRLQSFITKAPIAFGILTGRELVIEVANEMILKVWGKTASVLGQPLEVALPELKGQPYLSILDNVFVTGKTYIGDTAPVKLEIDGIINDCYFDFIYEPLKNDDGQTISIIVIANEVTERINKKKDLESLNQQLEIALNAGQLGSYHLNLISHELTGSEIFRSIYGIEKDNELHFQEIINTILPEYREALYSQVEQSVKSSQPYHAEFQIRKNDQTICWIHSSGLPSYDAEGVAIGMTGIALDITERKNYETQKDDFLGIASHELKTPLTSLKATIQLLMRLKDQPQHSSIPRLIDQSAKSMDKLNSLVDDLLNMHRISEGQLKLSKNEFNISRMLENCCQDIRLDGKFDLIIEGDKTVTAFADEHRIEQVIVNFVNNAVKYAPDSKKIMLQIDYSDKEVKIGVKDFGDGIDDTVQPYLFDRYFRVNHDGRKYSGLGLGLYISSEIIKGHGGTIGVDSIVGQGATFWFTLPI